MGQLRYIGRPLVDVIFCGNGHRAFIDIVSFPVDTLRRRR